MHDLHDHAVALAGLFQGLNPCINSVIDLQLVHEALGGDARNSFSDALWSFGLCDDPYRCYIKVFPMGHDAFNFHFHLVCDGR